MKCVLMELSIEDFEGFGKLTLRRKYTLLI